MVGAEVVDVVIEVSGNLAITLVVESCISQGSERSQKEVASVEARSYDDAIY